MESWVVCRAVGRSQVPVRAGQGLPCGVRLTGAGRVWRRGLAPQLSAAAAGTACSRSRSVAHLGSHRLPALSQLAEGAGSGGGGCPLVAGLHLPEGWVAGEEPVLQKPLRAVPASSGSPGVQVSLAHAPGGGGGGEGGLQTPQVCMAALPPRTPPQPCGSLVSSLQARTLGPSTQRGLLCRPPRAGCELVTLPPRAG